MGQLIPIVEGLFAVAFFGMIIYLQYGRSNSVLQSWADRNGFKIVRSEYRMMMRGPFTLFSGKGQTVYRVTVQDRNGRQRDGWVRCGGWFLGLLSNHADVHWDDN